MINVSFPHSAVPQPQAYLFPAADGLDTFATFKLLVPRFASVDFYTSDPDLLMQIAQSAANLSAKLRKQLAADAAAKAVLAEDEAVVPLDARPEDAMAALAVTELV